MKRSEKRIPLGRGICYVTDFQSANFSSLDSEDPIAGDFVRFLFKKYEGILARMPFDTVHIGTFQLEDPERFHSVRKTGKVFYLKDIRNSEGENPEDENPWDDNKFIKESPEVLRERYKNENIRSELILPIFIREKSTSSPSPFAYLWLQSKQKGISEEMLTEMMDITAQMSDQLKNPSKQTFAGKFAVSDISHNGVGFSLTGDLLRETLNQHESYDFTLHLPNQKPFLLNGSLRWWTKAEEGTVKVGLKIDWTNFEEAERSRFEGSLLGIVRKEEGVPIGAGKLSEEKEEIFRKVLYLDDDPTSLSRMSVLFQKQRIQLITASSLSEAFFKCSLETPAIIISGIKWQGMEDLVVLKALRKVSPGCLVIIYSEYEVASLRMVSYNWIWAQLRKPEQEKQLLQSTLDAVECYQSKIRNYRAVLEDESSLSGEIDWLLWKDYQRNSDQMTIGKNILNNISHSSAQGLGLGSLLINLDLAEICMKREDGEVLIPNDLMRTLLENKNMMRNWTDKLENLKSLFDLKIEDEAIEMRRIQELLSQTITSVDKLAQIKNNQISFESKFPDRVVNSNGKFLTFAVKELLINAMKFSPEGAHIQVMLYADDKNVSIGILNEIDGGETGKSGIPEKYSDKVFEPFFKLNHIYDERFHKEDFGFGIGLNMVQNLGRQVGCSVRLSEVNDYTGAKIRRKVAAEIKLPILHSVQ
ncbi:DUF1577 domain-containing protein [Leptospira fletcheri]|uniref:DUF1577 domain-containing protein n=1 Tax=Leptospira fletcheri TaxID=2484981 RepID=A0A4R9GBI9_9LEPT|nr:DUF1577 domain-containing protein [Leptospira fletcheri]TGK08735.1 DUF1577 domain-containing protein [Leptospira fletcheri]